MEERAFELVSGYKPLGDQPGAIDALEKGLREGRKYQTLMGVTGSGKTFTMANVIARMGRPALVMSHNKTLAAQLYEEFRELFPNNAVCYFVSYYDYYQPEAYIPQRDIYIEKDSSRNDDLDRLRLAATTALVSRKDVIVVASVSCIFGLGSPDLYKKSVISLTKGRAMDRQDFLAALADLQYKRADFEFKRGTYRVRGDVVELHPAAEEYAIRVEFFGDQVDGLAAVDPLTGELLAEEEQVFVYPAVHYVMPENQVERAAAAIREELDKRVLQFKHEGKLLEAHRIAARTRYDLEMIKEVGFCSGIENYSRHLDGRPAGAKPYTLLDYFPDATTGQYQGGYSDGSREDCPKVPRMPTERPPESSPVTPPTAAGVGDGAGGGGAGGDGWLLFIDESHVSLPQMRAMYNGDQKRKQVLVDHGFRLPSALDNRPLRFEEIEKVWPEVVFVSATPGPYELERCGGEVVEQVIRPTGLVDPVIEVRPAAGQVPDLMQIARERAGKGERTLVTTLTKRLAEDLAEYLAEQGLKCRYLHSDIETLDRVEILRDLREGQYDVLIGVNLLREGLDLPEVSLVAIMDADKTGFLRSVTSLIQQIGRAARNVNAMVVLYADTVTEAMRQAIDETERRRQRQLAFNKENGITPTTIKKEIRRGMELEIKARRLVREAAGMEEEIELDRTEVVAEMERQMLEAAEALEFERAASLRDRVAKLKGLAEGGVDGGDAKKGKIKPGAPGSKVVRKSKKKSGWAGEK